MNNQPTRLLLMCFLAKLFNLMNHLQKNTFERKFVQTARRISNTKSLKIKRTNKPNRVETSKKDENEQTVEDDSKIRAFMQKY